MEKQILHAETLFGQVNVSKFISLKESIGCYKILGEATGERHGQSCVSRMGKRRGKIDCKFNQ